MASVIAALRRFLPRFLATSPPLSAAQRRAIAAIRQRRTPALGGHLHACPDCKETRFAWHSCNHKACPQCGRAANAHWVERQLAKLANAPYFLVTFTLPEELRPLFFGTEARESFHAFFAAASQALADLLASPRWLGIPVNGATAVLHTWNQKLLFHPHLHFIVSGVGLDVHGALRRVKNSNFLVPLPALRATFKTAFRAAISKPIEPAVWKKEWGIHIQPCGSGATAVKYLGAYVARTAVSDKRIVQVENDHVLLLWKDRSQGGHQSLLRLDPIEFVRRYLRHVLPPRMHSVRYFGFCHPAAKKNRERVRFLCGMTLLLGSPPAALTSKPTQAPWMCPCCRTPMQRQAKVGRAALSITRYEDDS